MKVSRIVLSLVTFTLSVYALITKNFEIMPLMMLCLSLLMLVMGIEEFKKERKAMGILCVGAFLFALFVSFEGVLLN